jgi:hypothetical protein
MMMKGHMVRGEADLNTTRGAHLFNHAQAQGEEMVIEPTRKRRSPQRESDDADREIKRLFRSPWTPVSPCSVRLTNLLLEQSLVHVCWSQLSRPRTMRLLSCAFGGPNFNFEIPQFWL